MSKLARALCSDAPAVRSHSNRSTLTAPGAVQIMTPDAGTAKPLKYHAYRVKELGNTPVEAVTLFHVSPSDFLVEPLTGGPALERPTKAEAGGHVAPYPSRSLDRVRTGSIPIRQPTNPRKPQGPPRGRPDHTERHQRAMALRTGTGPTAMSKRAAGAMAVVAAGSPKRQKQACSPSASAVTNSGGEVCVI